MEKMIQDFPPFKGSRWSVITREILAVAAASVLYPFGLVESRSKRTARVREQRTVVLVHGYLANSTSMLPMRAYLAARGIKPVLVFRYPAGASIDGVAIQLRKFLRKNVRGGRIDLVCHSLGGVIASVYLQELGGARRVDRCVMLGSPLRGTYNAYWVPTQVGMDLRPDSPLMQRLQGSRAKVGHVKFTTIVAGSDNIVIPRVYASEGADVVHVPSIGHLGMLFSPAVFRAVIDRLTAA